MPFIFLLANWCELGKISRILDSLDYFSVSKINDRTFGNIVETHLLYTDLCIYQILYVLSDYSDVTQVTDYGDGMNYNNSNILGLY